ncbi:cyclin E isoform X2 [Oratosquilla oratoria]|uniref:cyclin E isoform X2 n=1 Tax=Oratosquilla oratoria TaxID=337810 RepID=UPI003F75A3BE
MSENQRRTKPAILRARKRKGSENEDDQRMIKQARQDPPDTTMQHLQQPLGDVTHSLNLERDRAGSSTTDSTQQPETWSRFRGLTCLPTPQPSRSQPLPHLRWAEPSEVWDLMCRKDRMYPRNPDYLTRHPALQARMRAILLDWLTEVCEVYKLHRETYYLSVDFIDRYLAACENVPKQQLQLIGITCLFIAAKIEEIYPPKLSDFAFVTDSACTEHEILEKELVILKCLNWDLSPITSNSWLNTYLQLMQTMKEEEKEEGGEDVRKDGHDDGGQGFVLPKYSGSTFVQIARLLDLCTLDISSLHFTSSQVAAAALCYLTNPRVACRVSGYSWEALQECCDWMAAFAVTTQALGQAQVKSFSHVPQDDLHNIQTHSVDLDILSTAQQRLNQMWSPSSRLSPTASALASQGVLTPPKTNEMPRCCVLPQQPSQSQSQSQQSSPSP